MIGIIGKGFVGNAVYEGMKHAFDIIAYDKLRGWSSTRSDGLLLKYENQDPHDVLINSTDVIFVCVPTPMKKDGSCDTSIVEEVISNLDKIKLTRPALDRLVKPMIVIKSTVPPGTTERLKFKYTNLDICFNPEFLREISAIEDFKNQDRIIIGGSLVASATLVGIYNKVFPNVPIHCMNATSAEMVKYTTNSFLAVKISFANEIKQLCDKLSIDYNEMISAAKKDSRLGNSTWMVPGNDGDLGFGKKCLSKDLNALIFTAKELGVDPKVMQASWEKNLEVRVDRDWERIPGATTNN